MPCVVACAPWRVLRGKRWLAALTWIEDTGQDGKAPGLIESLNDGDNQRSTRAAHGMLAVALGECSSESSSSVGPWRSALQAVSITRPCACMWNMHMASRDAQGGVPLQGRDWQIGLLQRNELLQFALTHKILL